MFPNGDAAFKTVFKGRNAPGAASKNFATSPTITGVREAGRQTGILIKAHPSLNSPSVEAKQAYTHHINDLIKWRDTKQDVNSADLTEDECVSREIMTHVQRLSEVVKRHDNQRGERRTERLQALVEQVKYLRDAAIAVDEEVSFQSTVRERCEVKRLEGQFNDAVREQNYNDKRYNQLIREFWPHKVPDLCLRAMPFREFSGQGLLMGQLLKFWICSSLPYSFRVLGNKESRLRNTFGLNRDVFAYDHRLTWRFPRTKRLCDFPVRAVTIAAYLATGTFGTCIES